MGKGVVIVVGIVLLACLAGGIGVVCVGGALVPASPSVVVASPVPVSTEAAEDFDRKVEEAQATRTPDTRQLVLTQEEITSRLAQGLASGGAPVRNLQVRLEPGVIVATGNVDLGFVSPQARVRIAVAVDDNVMSGRLEQVDLGGVPLPMAIQNQIITQALAVAGITVPPGTDITDLAVIRPPAELRTLRVEPGRMVLELRNP